MLVMKQKQKKIFSIFTMLFLLTGMFFSSLKVQAEEFPYVWQPVGNAGFSAARTTPIMDICNGTPYVVYKDTANADKITVKKYDGSNWVMVGNAGFSLGDFGGFDLKVYNDTPYVVYDDIASGKKATVMKYDGTNWVTVGNVGFSAGEPTYTSLYVDKGTPYIAYRDGANGNKATVMKYNGAKWITVGKAGFSNGTALSESLYVDNGTPYVSYQDNGGVSGKTTVMKYNGTGWVTVGSAGISVGSAGSTSMYVSNGIPYVAYSDNGDSRKVTVKKYYEGKWVTVGNTSCSPGTASGVSLYVDNGIPYLAYTDGSARYKVAVKKFDGSNWVTIGSEEFSGNSASMAAGSLYVYNGVPYVAYGDGSKGGKATVMKYDTVPVKTVTSVVNIADKNVPNGTIRAALALPPSINVTLSDASIISCAITWDNGTPAYDGTIGGTYSFTGELTLPSGVTNPNNVKAKVNVMVPSNPVINPTAGNFDKNTSAQADVSTTMTLNGNTLRSIANDGTPLILTTDYTVSGNTLTIKKEYLATKSVGTTNLILTFSEGYTQTLEVTISDTTPQITYTLTYIAGANGSITGNLSQTINSGANGTEVTAVPNAGYNFVKWSDDVTTATRTDNNVSGNISVTASFEVDTTYGKTVPDKPTNLTVTPLNGKSIVKFSEPLNNGGSSITSYTVEVYSGGTKIKEVTNILKTSTTINGLTNGTTYTFKVIAINEIGASAPSDVSNVVTPVSFPSVPRNVTWVPGDGQITINFDVPLRDGGLPIKGYTITVNSGGIIVSGVASPIVVKGLTNDKKYTITIKAVTELGGSSVVTVKNVTPNAP